MDVKSALTTTESKTISMCVESIKCNNTETKKEA